MRGYSSGIVLRALLAAALSMPAISLNYGPRVTASKNAGKDYLKPVRNSRYMPHQGEREKARRRRQMAKMEARNG